jgi:glycogen operon protein
MLLMGDECARTQKGNNNAYCQDNEISWLDWDRQKEFKEIFDFTKWLIALRQRSGYVAIQKKSSKVIWHGIKCYQPDWSHTSHSLAWEVVEEGKSFYVISNQYHGPLTFELPQTKTGWEKVMDTSQKQQSSQKIKEKTYIADPFSVSVFVSRWA